MADELADDCRRKVRHEAFHMCEEYVEKSAELCGISEVHAVACKLYNRHQHLRHMYDDNTLHCHWSELVNT
jgi:hypothetical protein